MSTLQLIRRLYEYHEWADDRLLEAAARVPEDALCRDAAIPFANARDNLLHVLGSQVSWLMRWTGEAPHLATIEPGNVAAWAGSILRLGTPAIAGLHRRADRRAAGDARPLH